MRKLWFVFLISMCFCGLLLTAPGEERQAVKHVVQGSGAPVGAPMHHRKDDFQELPPDQTWFDISHDFTTAHPCSCLLAAAFCCCMSFRDIVFGLTHRD